EPAPAPLGVRRWLSAPPSWRRLLELAGRHPAVLVVALVATAAATRLPDLADHFWIDDGISVGIASHGFIAGSAREAIDESFPYVADTMNRIGKERGWQPMTKADYETSATLRGSDFVGTPQQVIDKILFQWDIFHHDRFLVQFSVGTMPHDKILRSIELFGTEVAPAVREEVARRRAKAGT
ncbi:MAG TPA: hypothetical protein VHL54_09280, partial [Actinomycetota bacterium]|nr:hypothetical protein [Actinomycetota bacterium]